MKRTASLALLALLNAPTLAAQPPPPERVIERVEWVGAAWIDRELLAGRLGIAPGDTVDDVALARAADRLIALSSVRGATPRLVLAPAGVTLRIELEASQLVASVRLRGLLALSVDELGEVLVTRPGDELDAATLERDRKAIVERYQRDGYLFAAVAAEVSTIQGTTRSVEVVYRIEEGRRVFIRNIRITGNVAVPARHILAVMEHRRRILFGIISPGVYQPARLEEDLERVRSLYLRRGFLDARVSRGPMAFQRGFREVDLSIHVEEGPRYRIETIELGGSNPALDRAIKFQIQSRPGDIYDGDLLEEDRRRIVRFYERETRRVPEVTLRHFFRLSPDDPRVRVAFDIDERRRIFAGRVEVTGNARTRERVLRRPATTFPGEPLTSIEIGDTTTRLRGLFLEDAEVRTSPSATHVTTRDDESVDTRDVTLSITEKPRGDGLVEIGGGASSGIGEVFAVKITQPNFDIFDVPGGKRGWKHPFSGGGQRLELEAYPGRRVSEFRFLFEEPYVYNSFHKLSLAGTNQIYRWRRFDEIHLLGELGLQRSWDRERRVSTRVAWVLGDVNVSDVDPRAPADVKRFRGHTLLSYPSFLLAYRDAEPNFFSGASGLQAWTRLDLPLEATGSETDFVRSTTTLDLGLRMNALLNRLLPGEPLNEDSPDHEHVLRVGGRLGWMKDVGGDETPFFDRYFPGGPRSFPGFKFRGIGPREGGVPLGGNALWSASLEYSFPLVLREIRGVGRLDIGDLEPSFDDFAADRVRSAIGGGLQIRVRLLGQPFPINLYWMKALSSEPEDREEVFTFSLGYTF